MKKKKRASMSLSLCIPFITYVYQMGWKKLKELVIIETPFQRYQTIAYLEVRQLFYKKLITWEEPLYN